MVRTADPACLTDCQGRTRFIRPPPRPSERSGAPTPDESVRDGDSDEPKRTFKSSMDVPGKSIDRAGQRRSLDKVILDLTPGAPGVSETYGCRER